METGATKSSVSEATDRTGEATAKTPTEWASYWQKEMAASNKRMRKFRRQGTKVVGRYLDYRGNNEPSADAASNTGDGSQFRLNLFHTNVSTLQSMLYGSVPAVDVSREHQDPDDDVARVAALLYQRILEADVSESGGDFATTLKASLQDRLLPGLGIARVRYKAAFVKTVESQGTVDPATGMTVIEDIETERLDYELAKIEYVHWQDYAYGWCRTWTEMPWQAFRVWFSKSEATERFGEKIASELTYKSQTTDGETKWGDASADPEQKSSVEKAEIWEIWAKKELKVFWWSEGVDIILDAEDDPLDLKGFWPTPNPMMANLTTSLFMPRADFVIAQDLYNEIDVLQSRISVITRAVKVVGVYDEGCEGIGRMLNEGVENDLIPVPNWAMFAEKGGLNGTIDWFPVQEVVGVLQTLQQSLGSTIELLYQVTGMSDILRGANTDQYTSDGTNQLKAKFGSIRVQALQEEFARFASDLEELRAEVIAKHFSPESILKQSNAQFLPQPDLERIPPAIKLMQSPELRWRVNIRPESIAMVDYAQLKSERTEYLTAMATYLQSASTMVKSVPGALPVLLEMLKWGMAGFKGSNYLEGIMDQAIDMAKDAPPPGQDDGAQKAAQMEMQMAQQKHAADMELQNAKAAGAMQLQQAKDNAAVRQAQSDFMTEMKRQQAELQKELQQINANLQSELTQIQANLDSALRTEQAQSAYAIEEGNVSHDNTMAEIEENGKMEARQQDRKDDPS